jgi:hypothetical protein
LTITFTLTSDTEDLLLRWLKRAVKWLKIQRDAVNDLERGLPADQIAGWKDMVQLWEEDQSKPDPYVEPEEGTEPFPSFTFG